MRIHFAMGAEYHKQHFTDIKARLEERGHDCSYDYDGQEIAMLSDAGCTVLTEAPKLYNMNHNLCSKNIFWIDGTRKDYNDRELGMTHLVPSEWFVDRLKRAGREAISVGCPRLDAVIGVKPVENRAFYSNTCHHTITSRFDIGPKIYELPCDLKVKYHPYYSKVGGRIYDENIDTIYPDSCKNGTGELNTAEAQVVISDYATAAIDGIMLNRPTIFYYNKCYGESIYYNEDNVEIIASDGGYVCYSLDEIKEMTKRIMNGEDEKKERREELSEMFWGYKGESLDRIAEVIEHG